MKAGASGKQQQGQKKISHFFASKGNAKQQGGSQAGGAASSSNAQPRKRQKQQSGQPAGQHAGSAGTVVELLDDGDEYEAPASAGQRKRKAGPLEGTAAVAGLAALSPSPSPHAAPAPAAAATATAGAIPPRDPERLSLARQKMAAGAARRGSGVEEQQQQDLGVPGDAAACSAPNSCGGGASRSSSQGPRATPVPPGYFDNPIGTPVAAGRGGGGAARVKLTPLEQQVYELRRQNPGTTLIVEVGYKMRLFGEHAEAAARVCNIVCFPDHAFLTASFPVHRLAIYVRRLVQNGHRVGVVRQVESAAIKSTSANKSAPFERKVVALYTISTLDAAQHADKVGEEDHLAANQEVMEQATLSRYLVAIAESAPSKGKAGSSGRGASAAAAAAAAAAADEPHLGLLAVETSTGDVRWDVCGHEGLEASLLSLHPSEILLLEPSGPVTRRLVLAYAARTASCRVETIAPPKAPVAAAAGSGSELGNAEALEAAHRALGVASSPGGGTAEQLALSLGDCLGCTSDELSVLALPREVLRAVAAAFFFLSPFGLEGILKASAAAAASASAGDGGAGAAAAAAFQRLAGQRELQLGANALRQLEVVSTCSEDTGEADSVKGSLLHLLDRTRTSFGARVLRRWVLRPLADAELIQRRQDAVQEIKDAVTAGTGPLSKLPSLLARLPDLERGVTRLLHRTAGPSELVSTVQALTRVRDKLGAVAAEAAAAGQDGAPGLSPQLALLLAEASSADLQASCSAMVDSLDVREAKANNYEGLFRDRQRWSQVFGRKDDVEAALQHLKDLLPTLARQLKQSKAEYTTIQGQGEWLLEVPVDQAGKVPSAWQKICSTKKVHRYHPPEVKAGILRLEIAREHLKNELKSAWASHMHTCAEHYATCKVAVSALGQLDALCSLAEVAATPGYTRPVFVTGRTQGQGRGHQGQGQGQGQHGQGQGQGQHGQGEGPSGAGAEGLMAVHQAPGRTQQEGASLEALGGQQGAADVGASEGPGGDAEPMAIDEEGAHVSGSGAGAAGPTANEPTLLEAVSARHPMLDERLGGAAVPNDICLRGDGVRGAIVTGPNMGGKSCLTRTAALLVIMAQAGSFVPAASLRLHVFDAVFTRMGASDNLMLGRSTFMEELGDAADILAQATPRSLVIMDELGRGTATHDGVAIALATLRHLVEAKRCLTLFVTHYPEVAKLQDELPGRVAAFHMAYVRVDAGAAAPTLALGAATGETQGTAAEAAGAAPREARGAAEAAEPAGAASGGAQGTAADAAAEAAPGGVAATAAAEAGHAATATAQAAPSSAAVVPQITFLYKMVRGAADASFGLNVAQMAGLPRRVLERAAVKAQEIHASMDRQAAERRQLAGLTVTVREVAHGIRGASSDASGGDGDGRSLLAALQSKVQTMPGL